MIQLLKRTAILSLTLLLLLPVSLSAQLWHKGTKKAQDTLLVDVLQDEIARLRLDSLRLADRHKADAARIAELEKEVAALEPLRQQWADHLAASLAGKWDGIPYGEINPDSLNEDIALCDQFAPYNAQLRTFATALKQLKDRVDLFDLGVLIVNEPYNKAVVEDVAPKLEALLQAVRKEKRDARIVNPIAELSDQLSSYGIAVSVFQDLIRVVDPQLARFKSSEVAAWNAASVQIEEKEKTEEAVSLICQIPWLKTQYDAYYKALEAKPLGRNAARDTIMDLKP